MFFCYFNGTKLRVFSFLHPCTSLRFFVLIRLSYLNRLFGLKAKFLAEFIAMMVLGEYKCWGKWVGMAQIQGGLEPAPFRLEEDLITPNLSVNLSFMPYVSLDFNLL